MSEESNAKSGSFKDQVNLIISIASVLSLVPEVLMHNKVGARYVRLKGLFATIILTLFAALFARREPVWPLAVLLLLFWGRCIAHGIIWQGRLRRREQLGDQTTYYPGTPLIWRLMPGRSESYARWAEVAILFVAGLFISLLNDPLGSYLMFSSFALTLTLYLRYQALINKIMDMHDAVVLQRGLAESFRERSGG